MNRRKFAKVFDTDSLGQVLVVNDTDDCGDPAVMFKFDAGQFSEDLGVSSVNISSKVSDCDISVYDDFFDRVDQKMVDKLSLDISKQFDKVR